MRITERRLPKVFALTQDTWDQPSERAAVRDSFLKACLCRTPAMGGEVYRSAAGEKVFYHSCKSKSCPSCGIRATLLWQREQWATLPDIPFVGIVLTMPHVFWPVFKAHRHLQHDLPALGAAVIQQWAWSNYRVRLYVVVIQHTFGGRLNHNPHLHIMLSAGGLNPVENRWVESLNFDSLRMMSLWRFAVTSYLWKAHQHGLLQHAVLPEEFEGLICEQVQRDWNIHITRQMSKRHFLAYAGRYIRRLPISEKRILKATKNEILYQVKDTRTKTLAEVRSTPREFVGLLSQHVPDRYEHSMRYFGLLAPRTKRLSSALVFGLLGQRPRPKPRRQGWADSLKKRFGVDPLVDEFGDRMLWVGRRKPRRRIAEPTA
jgi:Putative transposase/Transposase zinc-binding domain